VNFDITEVSAQFSPVKDQWNTINFCGAPKIDFALIRLTYEVGVRHFNAGSKKLLGDKNLFSGSPACEFFNFQVPEFNGSKFYVVLNLYAEDSKSRCDPFQTKLYIEFDVKKKL